MSIQQNKQSEKALRDNLLQILTEFNIEYKHSDWTFTDNKLLSDNAEIKNKFNENKENINTEKLDEISFLTYTYKFEYNYPDWIEFKSDTNHDYC